MGLVSGSSSIPKSTAHDGGILGRSSRKTSWNSFTMGTESIVFSFPVVFTAQARIAHPPCYTRRMAFIIDIIFGVVPVKVPLNLKVSPFRGVNTTSFLWQSMLAKFSASLSIPSMTSKSVISTTFRSTWMVHPAITACPSFSLFSVTRSTLAVVPTDNTCIKGSTTNPA